ncbi:hypothetical protein EJB05_34328, partial [Eragrostis curvula]
MAPKISLKLLVDAKTNKVLFAEAGKEFVDFVFSLLTLPIGAVAKLISAGTMQGSIGRLYQSVDHIGVSYLQPGTDKSDLLQPKVLHPDARELLLLQGGSGDGDGDGKSPPPLAKFRLYTCAGHCATATVETKATCPQCRQAMSTEVTPMSAITSITMINKFSANKEVQLAEKYVAVGADEGLGLLRAALRSDTVLSDVFLARKK